MFVHALGGVWGGFAVRYCQKYSIDIVAIVGFLKNDFSFRVLLDCSTFFYVISFISLFHHFFIGLADSFSDAVIVEHIRFNLNASLNGMLFFKQIGSSDLLCK